MTKTFLLNLILIFLASFMSGCSVSPGIPGLDTATTRYSKAQKEGVDYNLIRINAQTILKQRPFDYTAYIKTKKSRILALSSQSKIIGSSSKGQMHPAKSYNSKNHNSQSNYGTKINSSRHSNFASVTAQDSKVNYVYRIGKKDILSIIVWDQPELTIPTENANGHVVDSDGHFYFPYAGKIQAHGKTTEAVRQMLERKLAKVITKPQVSVRILGFRSQKVYTSGAVLKPATMHINDVPLTVRDAISGSGGVSPKLFTGYATLTRGNKNISIDINRMLKYNDNRQNFLMRDGDRLHILEKNELAQWRKELNRAVQQESALSPVRLRLALDKERSLAHLKRQLEQELKSEQAKVFVMGEVHKPGSVKYQVGDGMSLVEAINDAGSFKEETVNPKGVFVIRQESVNDKIPTVYQLPLASVHSMLLAEQFTIRPRDIIYVTATPTIRWNRVLSQLIPSLTLVNTVSNLTR